ncbi:MAG: hypothetical protein L0Y71_02785 [Gemmataceae bacterium]|nr:hypothetical protein [Gemmataceae bacterium]
MNQRLAAAYLTMALGLTGCQGGRFVWVPHGGGGACVDAAPCSDGCGPKLVFDDGCHTSEPCPEPRRRTIFARGPQTKVVVERECPRDEDKTKAKAPAPDRERVAAQIPQQDVILVPKMVYVPYVAQAPTRAARLVMPVASEEDRQRQPGPTTTSTPGPKDDGKTTAAGPTCPPPCTDCGPTTIIEIRQMNERIDRLHRILERLTPGHRP